MTRENSSLLHRFEFQTALACLLAFIWTEALTVEGHAQDHAGDKQALVALYNATDGPNWHSNKNWLSDEPLDAWLGVIVSDGRVMSLYLSYTNLTGPIPAKLGNLANLEALFLGTNQLTGPIPTELSSLSNLRTLYLHTNQLTGPIPPELGQFPNLNWLDLSSNQLTGPIPAELGNLANLEELSLSDNQLTGPIPPELSNLSSLRRLDLSGNQLTEPIPLSFTNLTLAHFYFNGNSGLSVPDDAAVREWLVGIADVRDQDYSPSTPFVPVILSSAGRSKAYFTSELTLTNRGAVGARLAYTYTAHRGGGSGVASDFLRPGEQRIIPNAIEYLRNRRVPIPDTGNRIGTLRVTIRGFSASQVGVTVRTTTTVPEGRAGLAYPAVSAEAAFDEPVYLCGLRENSQDRSNVAFQHMGTPRDGSITLRTTVFSGDPEISEGHQLEDRMLAPGGFYQFSQLLQTAGFDNGYVRVERVEGNAPFYAYGVINDQANSDGSFVFPVTASSLEGKMRQTLPVIVETEEFTTELTLTNFSRQDRILDLAFVADGIRTPDETARFTLTLAAGQQRIIPDIIDTEMRRRGVEGIRPSRGGLTGALFATPESGDLSGIVVGARAGSPDGRGGQYGVFYTAVPDGAAFTGDAWIYGLQQNEENRTNLALVNTGEVDDSRSIFSIEIYDRHGNRVGPLHLTAGVDARRWRQINSILANRAPGITQAYVRIKQFRGNNPFLAYGVVNDGGAPGQRSGDGAYLLARE